VRGSSPMGMLPQGGYLPNAAAAPATVSGHPRSNAPDPPKCQRFGDKIMRSRIDGSVIGRKTTACFCRSRHQPLDLPCKPGKADPDNDREPGDRPVTHFNAFDGGSTEGIVMSYRNHAAGPAFALSRLFDAAGSQLSSRAITGAVACAGSNIS
jgi:hypothetical protein